MKPELKPCPFCSESKNLIVEHCEGTIIHPAYRVYCDNCGASTGYVDKANHVDNWNRRAPAEPVKVPSDIELDDLADDFHGYAGNYTRHGYPIPKFNHIGYAHALLSKYADPQPQQQSKGEPVGYFYQWELDRSLKTYPNGFPEAVPVYTTPQPQQTSDEWKQAIDHELVSFGSTADSYSSPKEAIDALIKWNVSVATDPKVNGGYKLVPIEPTEEMIEAVYNGDESQPGKSAYEVISERYKAMLEAAPEVKESP